MAMVNNNPIATQSLNNSVDSCCAHSDILNQKPISENPKFSDAL